MKRRDDIRRERFCLSTYEVEISIGTPITAWRLTATTFALEKGPLRRTNDKRDHDPVGNGCYVYLFVVDDKKHPTLGQFKVGMAHNVGVRLRAIQATCPLKLRLVKKWKFKSQGAAQRIEYRFHVAHAEHRIHSEWYDMSRNVAIKYLDSAHSSTYGETISPARGMLGDEIYAKAAAQISVADKFTDGQKGLRRRGAPMARS